MQPVFAAIAVDAVGAYFSTTDSEWGPTTDRELQRDKASSKMMKSSGLSMEPHIHLILLAVTVANTGMALRIVAYIPWTNRKVSSSTPSLLSAHQITSQMPSLRGPQALS